MTEEFPTCDVFTELIIRLLQRLNQLRDAALFDQGHFVVHVLIDEVTSSASGKTLHFRVWTGEQLHQLPNPLQVMHLRTRQKVKSSAFCYFWTKPG